MLETVFSLFVLRCYPWIADDMAAFSFLTKFWNSKYVVSSRRVLLHQRLSTESGGKFFLPHGQNHAEDELYTLPQEFQTMRISLIVHVASSSRHIWGFDKRGNLSMSRACILTFVFVKSRLLMSSKRFYMLKP